MVLNLAIGDLVFEDLSYEEEDYFDNLTDKVV